MPPVTTKMRSSIGLHQTTALAAGLILSCTASCEAFDSRCPPPPETPNQAADVTVLTYNIGNGEIDGVYSLRLKDQAYEDHISERIRSTEADIIALQEVLSPTACTSTNEQNPAHTCYEPDNREAPAKRILGPNYSVVCDANRHIECVGVHVDFGAIVGVERGGFVLDGAKTAPLPHHGCDYITGGCKDSGTNCDEESSISTLVIDRPDGTALRVVHVHPTAVGNICLQEQIQQAFDFTRDEIPTILLGDWNFNPSRAEDTAATALFSNYVGTQRRFRLHSVRDDECWTGHIDFVVSDFLVGTCKEWNAPKLDSGFDWSHLIGGRADHIAISCPLFLSEKQT